MNSSREEITEEIFEKLVTFAALELNPEERIYLIKQLNYQLDVVHELESISIDLDTPITSHGVPYTPQISPVMRSDEWIECPNPEAILAQAPQVEEGYVIVPDIPHTELE